MDGDKMRSLYDLMENIKREDKILIYGAGNKAAELYRVMKKFGLDNRIAAFVVKKKERNPDKVYDINVDEYTEYIKEDTKILIGLAYKNQAEVYTQLLGNGVAGERIILIGEDVWKEMDKLSAEMFASADYWNQRYLAGGNSGSGSYHRLAEFKAEIINSFVEENKIHSVIEWGCGDGNQLSLTCYPHYVGFDVSKKAIEICRQKYLGDSTKTFIWCGDENFADDKVAELALSLDVIFHLIEDEVFHIYMSRLFHSSDKYVCIYSSNFDLKAAQHVRHRKFTDWIEDNVKAQWKLIRVIKNKYPYDADDEDNTSMSDFYIYEKTFYKGKI